MTVGMTKEQAPDAPVLEVVDLQKHFPLTQGILIKRKIGAVRAVDGVNFRLGKGETLGLVGESGCGKSTVAKLLMGLETPTAGTVFVHGQDIYSLPKAEQRKLRRNIQLVMQDPYTSLNPRMTVGDIIAEPMEIHPDVVPKAQRNKRVNELLETVGLNPEHINRYPHQFSGGQRQRIGIARALALKPDILVCDEPVSALDVSIQAQVMNLLENLQAELGVAVLFIAHDLSVVRHLSDRVNVMYLGKIVETGTDTDIYERPAHPYTQALLSAVPVPDPTVRDERKIIRLEGDLPSPANPPSGCRFRTRCPKFRNELTDDERTLCIEQEPALEDRSAGHPNACHYARVTTVL